MKKILLTIFLASCTLAIAQNESGADYRGLSVFIGTNAINDLGPDDDPFSPFTSFNEMGFGGVPIAAGVSYRYSDLVSLSTTVSFNKYLANRTVSDTRLVTEDINFFSFEMNARFHLDFFFNDFFAFDEKLDFFAETGLGYFELKDQNIAANAALGINYWMNDNLALTLKSVGRFNLEDVSPDTNHIQYLAGFTYHTFKDKDRDGVADKKDVCPNIPGLKEFDGCPDSDSDGIPDNKDECPLDAGSAENNGCPDSDGDGIVDKDDTCPNAAGDASMGGCPDNDGDMVADNVDKCPGTAGPAANGGCPWPDSDNDGVADKDDACPNEAGVAANNGCPAEPTGLIEFINSSKSTILFRMESAQLSSEANVSLDELFALLNKYPKANIILEGHASSDGPAAYNQKLSEKRAEALKAYLVEAGVDASRLEAIGYGEDQPAEDNASSAGRKANRRAKISRGE